MQLAHTTKPTGETEVPAHVKRAYDIEQAILERMETRDLNDADSGAGDNSGGDDDDDDEGVEVDAEGAGEGAEVEIVDGPSVKIGGLKKTKGTSKASPTPVLKMSTQPAGSSVAPRNGSRRNQAVDFMSSVTASLDPAARDVRDETRFARRLAQDELNRLMVENRDLRARNDALLDRLQQQSLELQQRINDITRLQGRVEMYEMMQNVFGASSRGRLPFHDIHHTPTRYRSYSRSYYRDWSPPPSSPSYHTPSRNRFRREDDFARRVSRSPTRDMRGTADNFFGASHVTSPPSHRSPSDADPHRSYRSQDPSTRRAPILSAQVVPGPSTATAIPSLDILAQTASSSHTQHVHEHGHGSLRLDD